MDFPTLPPSHLTTICTYSAEVCQNLGALFQLSSAASQVWPAANRTIHIPFNVESPFLIKVFFWANGGSVTGNVDAGIYSGGGTLITSTGSTAQAGTNTVQSVTLGTPVLLQPGQHYMALVCSSGSAQMVQNISMTLRYLSAFGITSQDTALPLPATMTPTTVTTAFYPVFGISSVTTF